MLFNSLNFVVFLGVVFVIYLSLTHRAQNIFLLAGSILFYAAWDWRFLGLLFFSVVLDFFCGKRIAAARSGWERKCFLTLSIFGNLGVLGFFKYFNFFTKGLIDLLQYVGFDFQFQSLYIVLPLGISFYTFQSMSYTIDLYRGETRPVDRFLDFALYVTFFPQLVAGPIERATSLLPQLLSPRTVRWSNLRAGSYLILCGYFKKMVIADNLAGAVEKVFDKPLHEGEVGINVLIAVYCFAFQIYGDFAGYTDIARGVAKLFGIELRLNFRRPYLAAGASDFWRRWHISLSTWLRDYLYIPLGGNRGGRLFTFRNLFLTMLLGGLWHGAAWHFVAWGAYWGIILILHRILSDNLEARDGSGGWVASVEHLASIFLTFHWVCIGWMLFRTDTMERFWIYLQQIAFNFRPHLVDQEILFKLLYFVPVYFVFEVFEEYFERKSKESVAPNWLKTAWVLFMVGILISHGKIEGASFIYFQF